MADRMTAIRVLGIDLSLTGTGIATRHGAETVKPPGRTPTNLAESLTRLRFIRYRIRSTLQAPLTFEANMVDLVVIEGLALASRTGKATERAGLWWAVVNDLSELGVPVAVVTPSGRAKYATGKGNSGKDEVMIACVQRLPIMVTNNNEADAAVLCAMGHEAYGDPLATMPAQHSAALSAVAWPAP